MTEREGCLDCDSPYHARCSHNCPPPPRLLEMVDGHVLLEFTPKPTRTGELPHGTALFAAPERSVHRYVVWTLINHPDVPGELPTGAWFVEQGDYVFTLPDALAAYTRRGGLL